MLIVAGFWTSTLVAELFLGSAAVAAVKHAIVYGLFFLVPFLAATGGSGFALGRRRQGRDRHQAQRWGRASRNRPSLTSAFAMARWSAARWRESPRRSVDRGP